MGNPVTWFEVVGKDGPALQRFYSEAFGWQLQDPGSMNYGMLMQPEKGIGGGIGQGGRATATSRSTWRSTTRRPRSIRSRSWAARRWCP
jgi:predicted enzyme related to lactoylglutathione lyase